jgi:hypothetical protein
VISYICWREAVHSKPWIYPDGQSVKKQNSKPKKTPSTPKKKEQNITYSNSVFCQDNTDVQGNLKTQIKMIKATNTIRNAEA